MESTLTADQIEAQSLPKVTARVFGVDAWRSELTKFSALASELTALAKQYQGLMIQGIEDKSGYQAVHEARIAVRDKRISVEKTRKTIKEEALQWGRAVDSEAKRLMAILEPVEAHLTKQEDAIDAERQRIKDAEAAARKAVVQGRVDALKQLGTAAWFGEVETWSDTEFQMRLEAAKQEADRREKEAAEAERNRIEAAARREAEEKARAEQLAAERAEMARVKAEQERVAAELRAEADRLAEINRRLEEDRKQQQERINAERAKQEAAQKEWQDKIDAGRRKAEAEEAERKRQELAAETERQRVAALEQAKREAFHEAMEAERQRQAEFEASRQRELEHHKAEESRLEAERPTREKILAFAQLVSTLSVPLVPAADKIQRVLDHAAGLIRKLADKPMEMT